MLLSIAYEGEGRESRDGYRDQIVTCDVGVSLKLVSYAFSTIHSFLCIFIYLYIYTCTCSLSVCYMSVEWVGIAMNGLLRDYCAQLVYVHTCIHVARTSLEPALEGCFAMIQVQFCSEQDAHKGLVSVQTITRAWPTYVRMRIHKVKINEPQLPWLRTAIYMYHT